MAATHRTDDASRQGGDDPTLLRIRRKVTLFSDEIGLDSDIIGAVSARMAEAVKCTRTPPFFWVDRN
jgi:hypothetical protein